MARGGTQNREIARQVRLRMRRHHATQRRLHLDNPDRRADLERAAQPCVLDKAVSFASTGVDKNVGAKAARVENRIAAAQALEMLERSAGQYMNRRRVEERAAHQSERVGQRLIGKIRQQLFDRNVGENRLRINLAARTFAGLRALLFY